MKQQTELSGFERPTIAEIDEAIEHKEATAKAVREAKDADRAALERLNAVMADHGAELYAYVDGEHRWEYRRVSKTEIVRRRVKQRSEDGHEQGAEQ